MASVYRYVHKGHEIENKGISIQNVKQKGIRIDSNTFYRTRSSQKVHHVTAVKSYQFVDLNESKYCILIRIYTLSNSPM